LSEEARGTASYRAPELYQEQASFNNKVDIWALGCILFELVVLQKAFPGTYGWTAIAYLQSDVSLSIPFRDQKYCYRLQISELVDAMLERNPSNRPSADQICDAI